MVSFETSCDILESLVEELPQEILKGLNCGIIMLNEIEYDKNGLIILGQYHFEPRGLGRYITIYYGSIKAIYGYSSDKIFAKKIKEVLNHELTHHLEHLAGDRTLEKQDEIDKAKYLRGMI